MLTSYHKIGHFRGSPRIWLESTRLQQLGFDPKSYLQVQPAARGGIVPEAQPGKNPSPCFLSANEPAGLPHHRFEQPDSAVRLCRAYRAEAGSHLQATRCHAFTPLH